jgi:hypothetical protein
MARLLLVVTTLLLALRMPQLTAQDIANCLAGLAQLHHTPSEAWLERAYRRFRWGAGGAQFVMEWYYCVKWYIVHCRYPASCADDGALAGCREVVPISGVNPPALVKLAWALAELQV